MKQKTWNRIFEIELVVGIVVSVILEILSTQITQFSWIKWSWVALVLLVIILCLRIWGRKKKQALLASKWLSSLILIFVDNFLVYTAISALDVVAKPLASVWSVLGILLLLTVGIPVAAVNLSVVKNWFMRLVVVLTLVLNYLYNANRFWGGPQWSNQLTHLGVVTGIATFILTFFILKAWGLKTEWNLKFVKTKNFQLFALVGLILLSIWFAFFNTFISLVSNVSELFCFWQWDLSTFEVTSKAIMEAAPAGIMEETIRFLNLVILLYTMRNFKYRVVVAVFVTSLMFSLTHLTNFNVKVLGARYSIEDTLQQVVYTFGAGMLLAVLYLYTGKLWVSMVIHGMVDLISFSKTPLSVMGAPLITNGWLATVVLMLIPLTIALVMLTGKRRKFMEDNADRIVATR